MLVRRGSSSSSSIVRFPSVNRRFAETPRATGSRARRVRSRDLRVRRRTEQREHRRSALVLAEPVHARDHVYVQVLVVLRLGEEHHVRLLAADHLGQRLRRAVQHGPELGRGFRCQLVHRSHVLVRHHDQPARQRRAERVGDAPRARDEDLLAGRQRADASVVLASDASHAPSWSDCVTAGHGPIRADGLLRIGRRVSDVRFLGYVEPDDSCSNPLGRCWDLRRCAFARDR